MATITLTLTAAVNTRVQAAFAKAFEADRKEGESDADFVKRKLCEFACEVTKSVEANEAAEAARVSAIAAAETALVFT